MSTGNFYPHKNGIFTFSDVNEAEDCDLQMDLLIDKLEQRGYSIEKQNRPDTWLVLKNDLIAAELSIAYGYYDGAQLIVETDKDNLDEYAGYNGYTNDYEPRKWYTPYNKTILKIVAKTLTPIEVYAVLNNGETIYKNA